MTRAKKERADALLTERKVASTADEAERLIMAGVVVAIDSRGRSTKVTQRALLLDPASTFRITGARRTYASRGGDKLAFALDAFGIDVSDRVAADIGASTGGFTDCLLTRGARRVHAVDVGYGIIDWRLRNDPRVVLHERTNAKDLAPGALGELVDRLVVDVSFIGLARVLPALAGQVASGGSVVGLVKPQFELPAARVGARGIVTDPSARQQAVEQVIAAASAVDLVCAGNVESPITGARGNVEHFVWLLRK